ncbi:MAG: hypothetical protein JO270_25665, partial [Acidobacteriaceae bacterium]|nr:hypothetical protein [Acidobacteriaceae bacterium]
MCFSLHTTALAICLIGSAAGQQLNSPPKTEKVPARETIHGQTVTDDYRWLEDQNSPQTRAWIAAQQKYAAQFFAGIPERAKIRAQLEPLERIEDRKVPSVANGKYFFRERLAHEQQPSIYVQNGADARPRVLVEARKLSADESVSPSIVDVSRDGHVLAYALRRGGQDETEIHFLDVENGKDMGATLPRARYFGSSLMPDGTALYYSRLVNGGTRVFRHPITGPHASDVEILGAAYGPEYVTGCHVTITGNYLFCTAERGSATVDADLYEMRIGQDREPKAIARHVQELAYATLGDRVYLLTAERAPNHKIMQIELARAAPSE